ncbi:helix-turn-helix domain-containing protein [Streptomyces mirabilis]|uniref:helix-turn-helix domain-containing protein n=1 Tax=Streptomyces mirabilis TaxID=68239 RepID=UPI003685ADF9
MQIVDVDDPALAEIGVALRQAQASGTELDEAAVAEAVRIGRERWTHREEPSTSDEPIAAAFDSIVYYIRRGLLVKIGTTRSPEQRFLNLLPDEILAVEPGDRTQERKRHVQFKHLRLGTSEHFKPAPDLMDHIAMVRTEHGAPDPTWPTAQNLDRPRVDFHNVEPPVPTSPEVVTASEGAAKLGVRRNTVSGWVHRGRLRAVGKNEQGRNVYFIDEMAFLAGRSKAMTEARIIRIG